MILTDCLIGFKAAADLDGVWKTWSMQGFTLRVRDEAVALQHMDSLQANNYAYVM